MNVHLDGGAPKWELPLRTPLLYVASLSPIVQHIVRVMQVDDETSYSINKYT